MGNLILEVDGRDEPNGTIDRRAAHRMPGIRHRAFVVTLEVDDRILFARRSSAKKGWPGFWDASVASHPGPEEKIKPSALRRIEEELGLSREMITGLRFVEALEYKKQYDDEYVEWEYCHFLRAQITSDFLKPNDSEVDALIRVNRGDVPDFLQSDNRPICPWIRIAYEKFLDFNN